MTTVRHALWQRRGHLLLSPALSRLGILAGASTRALGSMGGNATPPEAAARARSQLAARLGFEAVVRARQVHGDRVVRAGGPFEPWPEADALWTDRPGVLLGVVMADCVPVLIADRDGRLGAAHAGWEGTTRRVALRLAEALRAAGADLSQAVAAIGPSIGPCCYTVGPERVAAIRERLGAAAAAWLREGARGTVFDLWSANAEQLRGAGVGTVEVSGSCTRCGGDDLWSWRGRDDGRGVGLGLGFIGRAA